MVEKPRVLLIDDSELVLEGLRNYLSARFEVVTASDGFDALTGFRNEMLDLIITDLLMPAASGFGLISSLRAEHPCTPIIAMTGWGNPASWDDLQANLLMKPFELADLDDAIGRMLIR